MKEKDFLIIYGLVAIMIVTGLWEYLISGTISIGSFKNPGMIFTMLCYIVGVSWLYDKFRKTSDS
jgi:hypothetical protein